MRTAAASRWTRVRASMTRAEWRRAGLLAAVVLGLHAVGFLLLFAVVAPQGHALGATGAFGVGLGVTAYTLGLRHAFDADHIGAIDNTTRKLMAEGQRPLSVGFWFSLGHSTIVFALGVLVVVGVRGLSGAVEDDGSSLQRATGLIGPLVSGTFLLVIGLLNLVVLVSIAGIFRRMRRGDFDEAEIDAELGNRSTLLPPTS
jgi:high-affinity nickel-transport protein